MTIEYDQQELINEYIAKQNRKIANLTAENIMLETRLEMAEKKLTKLIGDDPEVMDGGTFEEPAEEEEK